MRDIKLRAWDNKQKEIHTWESLKCNSISVAYLFNNTDLNLMQYAGLKDKNGVEIYEGDIILTNGKKYKVWFSGVAFGLIENNGDFYEYICNLSHLSGKTFEAIGNIYENPEMLENENI